MAQSKFKTGDRVYWRGNEYGSEDYGTVQPDSSNSLGYPDVGRVWVLWDSDGKIQQISEDSIECVLQANQSVELTVQNCIDFLISQGYSVTVSK